MATGLTTIGTVAQTLVGYRVPVLAQLRLKALSTNTKSVFVGEDSSVSTTNGYELTAGEELLLGAGQFPLLSEVWLVADTSAQKVCWTTEQSLDALLAADSFAPALDFSLAADSQLLFLLP